MVVVTTVMREEVAKRRAEREAEIERLGALIARSRRSQKMAYVSELLATLGIIHNTPGARREWEDQ